jgi:osmotically-inducible protein OsmY
MVALAVAPACNRADTDEDARRAAAEFRQAADAAGEQLADSWLTTKIQAQYFADEDVKARYINVTSRDGVVTLAGRVDDERGHEQAVQIARNTDGVKQVNDKLAVGAASGSTPERLDADWITTQLQSRLFADQGINSREIDVNTADGVVTLSGRVNTQEEKERAVALARNIEGVTRVDDRLAVQPSGSPEAVATTGPAPADPGAAGAGTDSITTSRIQAKFFLDSTLKGRSIDVNTRQRVVTLSGEVASDDERAQALLLARTTEGVDRVEDAMTVSPPAVPAAQAADTALADSVKAAFASDRLVKGASIEVTAKDGVVLLDGTAPTAAVKQRALSVARGMKGVTQVIDRITVRRVR